MHLNFLKDDLILAPSYYYASTKTKIKRLSSFDFISGTRLWNAKCEDEF